jgi:hypothetical protein
MIPSQSLELDLEKIALSNAGVANFYWPISLAELRLVRDELYRELIVLAQELLKTDERAADIFNIIFLHLFNEILAIYQACLLKQRATAQGYHLSLSKDQRLLIALESNTMPQMPVFISKLEQGLQQLRPHRWPLRFLRDLVISSYEYISRIKLRKIDFKKDAVTIIIDQHAQHWAKQTRAKVTYVRESKWFAPLATIKSVNAPSAAILQAIKKVFLSNGNLLPTVFEKYLINLIEQAFAAVNTHIDQINPNMLPQELWTPTGGSLWARILSNLVRKSGGRVTRFDHAGGVCFFKDLAEMGPRELENCDTYVTFSKKQAQNLTQYFPKNMLIHNTFPAIEFSTNCVFSKVLRKSYRKNINRKNYKIMYVPTIFPGEKVDTISGFMSDTVLLDWQIRLLNQLQSWSYTAIAKPHPEGKQAPQHRIQSICNNLVNEKRFEKALDDADILLLDMPASTTFPVALISHKPIVYLHFSFLQLNDEFLALLDKRCAVVNCWLDENNRAQVNWEELHLAIETCFHKRDRQIVKDYYNCNN